MLKEGNVFFEAVGLWQGAQRERVAITHYMQKKVFLLKYDVFILWFWQANKSGEQKYLFEI